MSHHVHQVETLNEVTGRLSVATIFNDKSRTQQHHKDSCDINHIMRNFAITGELPTTNKVGSFADYSNITDYQGMLETVRSAQNAFMQLPANIRTRFENDPNQLLHFINNSQNYEEALKLGLINPKKTNDPNEQKTSTTTDQKNSPPKKTKTTTITEDL